MEKTVNYEMLAKELEALTRDIPYETANLANASALLWQTLPDINWAGFYKMTDGKLVLGPFQGKPACIVIPVGRGVCGTAVAEDRTQLVFDVHQFPGHIACDCASNSEIVVPIHVDGEIWGVLDIDSPTVGRFTETDRAGLEQFVLVLERMLGN
ncbi:MAG: GAF domain-containing protein [Oscillospiraceae bacterium]|nr:GAF domain-containing protein [Oscillospiraceae bacterium]